MADAHRGEVIKNDSSQFEEFRVLAKQLLGVPKVEVDKQCVKEDKSQNNSSNHVRDGKNLEST